MEMNKKYARTTEAQLRWYVAFVKYHPAILQGKNCPSSPNLMNNLWQEIATNLNAMMGASRSCDAWREGNSLRNWRKQLRARVRKVMAERNLTGGGQNTVPELTDFEQQALEAFGISAAEGHSDAVLGFPAENDENIPPRKLRPVLEEAPSTSAVMFDESVEISPEISISLFCSNSADSPSPAAPSAAPQTRPGSRAQKRTLRSEIFEIVENDRRERRDDQLRMSESLNNLGNGLSTLASAIQELVALQRQQQN